MKYQLLMFEARTSQDTPSATSLPGSADGHLPCASQAGLKTDRYGREAAHASHLAQRGSKPDSTISGTSGLSSSVSSRSASLQSALASRLQASLDVNGSLEFSLTWKTWAMPQREPICALRASGRITNVDEEKPNTEQIGDAPICGDPY